MLSVKVDLVCYLPYCPLIAELFLSSTGVMHWHILVRLPGVLDTGLIGRMIQNGRVVRQEIKCGNIKPGRESDAWSIVEAGLLAQTYATLFGDSISMAAFYEDDDKKKPLDLYDYRNKYFKNYVAGNINLETNACMRRFDDRECDPNPNVEIAKVAAISCMHECISDLCGGDSRGIGCRFQFPHKPVRFTTIGILNVSIWHTLCLSISYTMCDC